MSVNRVILVGRLTRDPESRTTTTGTNVVECSIAVDKRVKPKDASLPTADFFRVKAWGQTGQFIADYGSKGRLVSVEGRFESRKYTDKDGNNREVWEVIADQMSLLDRPRDEQGGGGAPAAGGGAGYSRGNSGSGGGSPASAPPDEYDPFADE